jgi:hypothetical protein
LYFVPPSPQTLNRTLRKKRGVLFCAKRKCGSANIKEAEDLPTIVHMPGKTPIKRCTRLEKIFDDLS